MLEKKIHNTTPRLNRTLGGGAEMPLLPCPFSKIKVQHNSKKKRKRKEKRKRCLQRSALDSHHWLTFHPCKYSQEGKPVTRTHPKKEIIENKGDEKNDEIGSQ
jgi:hypothetical protein